jgi:hypothetical protein
MLIFCRQNAQQKKWLDSVDAKHRAKALNYLSYDAVTSVSYKDEPTGITELDSLDFTKKESYLIDKVEELQAFRIFCRAFESCKDLPTIARISETNEALSKLLIEAITNMTEVDLQGVKNAFDAAVRKEEEELASKSKPKKDPHITSTEQFAKKDRDHVTPPSLVSVI